jgi:hypothetical protein
LRFGLLPAAAPRISSATLPRCGEVVQPAGTQPGVGRERFQRWQSVFVLIRTPHTALGAQLDPRGPRHG